MECLAKTSFLTILVTDRSMRILLAQINPTIGDFTGNTEKIISAINIARKQKARLVVFPELTITGYPPEDFLLLPHFIEEVENCLEAIVNASFNIGVIVGLPRRNRNSNGKPLFNSAAIIDDGKLLGFQDKSLLPTYDVFDELRYFEPSQSMSLWEIDKWKIAVTICEDIWQHGSNIKYTSYNRDPVQELAQLHPDLVVNLSASPYNLSKFASRYQVCATTATSLQCPLLLCNQVGGNDSLIFDGYSLWIGARGELIDYAKGFVEDLWLVDLDEKPCPKRSIPVDSIENLHDALVLGLSDYFRKLKFHKACLGLSGGIDSAIVAYLAAEALGSDNVLAVTMPSRYSSDHSMQDALALINTLGLTSRNIPIEGPFCSFLDLLEPQFDGKAPDVTEENLQARIRGMILMALSNKLGYLVLSTGNKSELAVGYSTLYGDLCGGLSVIGDVFKTQIYALARWINREKEIIPWHTIHKPPSAELRPNQKDSDSLPDYDVLDNILQAYVEEHQSPEAIAKIFDYPLALIHDIVKRIHNNEYKRRQAPPSLRVTEKAFSVGRRFPIVQRFI